MKSVPVQNQLREQRGWKRKDISASGRLRIISASDRNITSRWGKILLNNMSFSGLGVWLPSISWDDLHIVGDLTGSTGRPNILDIRLRLPSFPRQTIAFQGAVRWYTNMTGGPDYLLGIGILLISREDRDRLLSFIKQGAAWSRGQLSYQERLKEAKQWLREKISALLKIYGLTMKELVWRQETKADSGPDKQALTIVTTAGAMTLWFDKFDLGNCLLSEGSKNRLFDQLAEAASALASSGEARPGDSQGQGQAGHGERRLEPILRELAKGTNSVQSSLNILRPRKRLA